MKTKTLFILFTWMTLLCGTPCLAREFSPQSPATEQSKEKQVLDTVVSSSEWRAFVDKLQEEGWTNIKVTKDGENRKIHAERYTKSERIATLVSDFTDEKGIRTQFYDLHTPSGSYGLLQLSPAGDTLLVRSTSIISDQTDNQGIRTVVYNLFDGTYCVQQLDKTGKGISNKIVDKKPE